MKLVGIKYFRINLQGPSLDLYTEYVRNFKHAANTLGRYKAENDKFANFLKEVRKKMKVVLMEFRHTRRMNTDLI